MRYRLSEMAEEDIISIFIEGTKLFGIAQAESYHAELELCFDVIASAPELARERLEITPPVRIHPFQAHIIVYVLDEDRRPYILRVRHGRENWDESG